MSPTRKPALLFSVLILLSSWRGAPAAPSQGALTEEVKAAEKAFAATMARRDLAEPRTQGGSAAYQRRSP